MLALTACGSDEPAGAGGADTAVTFASHDALVEAARAEGGTLVAFSSAGDETNSAVEESFEAKYPFIDVEITEQSGSEAERIILEVQAATSNIDVLHMPEELYTQHLPYLANVDLLAMSESGVLDIPTEMIDHRNARAIASTSAIAGISYNPNRISASEAPQTWDDLLDPRFGGGKFLVDIEPANLATLGAAWGVEKLTEYAEAIGRQKPIWVRGDTFSLTALTAGEHAVHAFSNFHSATRIQKNSPDSIVIVLPEPIPVRISGLQAIREGSDHVAAATLYLEHLASPEIQRVFDDVEVAQSSIYREGAMLNELTDGKELSVMGWDEYSNYDTYFQLIGGAWGFPTAQLSED